MYVKNGCEGVIAFGGGSAMDCAKVASARVVKPNQSVRAMRGQLKVHKKLPPLFAVPTTAGTGSETTVAAVVTDPETHEKNAVNDTCLRPLLFRRRLPHNSRHHNNSPSHQPVPVP